MRRAISLPIPLFAPVISTNFSPFCWWLWRFVYCGGVDDDDDEEEEEGRREKYDDNDKEDGDEDESSNNEADSGLHFYEEGERRAICGRGGGWLV